MISRRSFGRWALACGAGLGGLSANAGRSAAAEAGAPLVDPDGMFTQRWLLQRLIDLREDRREAAAAGKRFAILWEQKGCPYCREMHRVNFAIPQVRDFVRDNFAVLQLNIWGSREVTDFDGKALEERALARRSRITFTPTFQFFPDSAPSAGGQAAEVTRMAGYFRPFHFLTMFEFVRDKAYSDTDYQRFLLAKTEEMRRKGIKVELW